MSKLTDLMKEYGISTQKGYPERAPLNIPEIKKVYGEVVEVEVSNHWRTSLPDYVWIKCPTPKCEGFGSHQIIAVVGGAWAYRWAGQSYLISKNLLPIEVLHNLSALKKAELAEARKKRFETIKSARDAVRVTFRDLKIKHDIVGGSPRVNCGPFWLEFAADTESPSVPVSIVYRDSYLNKIELIVLTVADPKFNNKVQAIIHNGQNLNKLLLGELHPEVVSKV